MPEPLANRRLILAVHAAALAMILTFFTWHALGHAVPTGLAGPQCDNLTQALPKLAFYARELRAGRLPTWDPYAGTGAADYPIRSHVMYPTTLLTTVLLPPWLALLADYFLAFVIAYFLAFLFFRRSRAPAPLAAAAALAVVFGGLNLRYVFYPYFSQTAAWIPLVFLAVDGLFTGRRPARAIAWGGLALGMMILAGMLNYVIYTLVFGGLYVLWLTGQKRPEGDGAAPWWRFWLAAAAIVVVGFALGAARLAPLLEQLERLRGGYGKWEAFRGLLQTPSLLVASLAPGAFGEYRFRLLSTTLAYGMLAWAPAVAFVFGARKARIDWFWIGVVGVGLVTVVYSPLTRLLFHVLPGYAGFEPTRIWSVAGLGLLWLALRGLNEIAGGERGSRVLAIAAVIAGLWLAAFLALALRTSPINAWHLLPLAVGVTGLVAAWPLRRWAGREKAALMLAALLALEVFARAGVSAERIDTRRLYRETPITTTLRNASPPARVLRVGGRWGWIRDGRLYTQESLKFDGVEDLHAYSSMIDPSLRRVFDAYRARRDFGLSPFDEGAAIQPFLTGAPAENGFADSIGANFILSQEPLPGADIDSMLQEKARHGGLILYQNKDALPRAFWTAVGWVARNDDEMIAELGRQSDWSRGVWLDRIAPSAAQNDEVVAGLVRPLLRRPTYEKYEVTTPGGGYLVVTELYDKHWTATVNGQSAPVRRANLAFRGVAVKDTKSVVEFRYEPWPFYLGLAFSHLGAWAVVLLLWLGRLREPTRKEARPDPVP
ncbi:MAG: YfhO family protein [Candidatus Lernaella stagnicola]|nr:YfhO family protein [Candidatus Lernaella stagnicola]